MTPADLAAEVARLLALVAELTHPYEDQGAVSNLVGCGHVHRSPTGRAFRCAEPPDAAVHQVPGGAP